MKKSKLISVISAAVLAANCTLALGLNASASDKNISIGTTSLAFDISSSTDNVAASSYPKTTTDFVTRMYNVVLNRKPDSTGLNNWVKKLNNHTATAADIIDGFFFSDEYKGKKKSADEMVTDCYKAMLDRSPDSTGKANWTQRLNVGMTMQAICKGFVGSDEFKGLCKTYGITPGTINLRLAKDESYDRTYFVYRLYKNCLGRTPDGTGLENWCKQIKNGKTGSNLAQGFIFSDEYKNKKTSDTTFVKMLYETLLGRTGNSSEISNWTNQLSKGKSREYVTNGFIFSNEFKGQCNKIGLTVGNKIPAPEDISQTITQINTTIYNNNHIIIKYEGISLNSNYIELNLYIENNKNQDIRIKASESTINGCKITPYMSSYVLANRNSNVTLTFFVSDLTKNNISKINTITTKILILDFNNNTTITTTNSLKIKTDYSIKQSNEKSQPNSKYVYITKTGKKYHYCNPCGKGTYYLTTLEKAKAAGLSPCEKCVLH